MRLLIDAFFRIVDGLSRVAAALAALFLAIMTLLMLGEVVARNLFNVSLEFSWEFSGYLMGAVFLLGAAYTLRHGGHVRVSLLAETAPPGFALALEYVATLIGLVMVAFLFYALLDLTLISYRRGVLSFTPMETPLVIPQGIITLGAFLLLVQMAARLLRLILGEATEIADRTLDVRTDQ